MHFSLAGIAVQRDALRGSLTSATLYVDLSPTEQHLLLPVRMVCA